MTATPTHANVDAGCPTEDALVEFVAGTGTEDERSIIEDHIDTCTRCAETLALFGGAYGSSLVPVDAPAVPEPPPPESFAGRYRIRECVGAGAGGTVYAAWDPELDRIVALKVLRGHASGGSRGAHRIAREARVMAKVMHPNVVAVHDVGQAGEHVFIAAEFVEGCTLDDWRKAKPRGWAEVVEVFVAAGRGLAAIHECGLVHRDFKPHNVMVGDDGRVRVTDFGLARLQPELEQEHQDISLDTAKSPSMSPGMLAETLATQTRTGALVGTPAYMSPEQWRGDVADGRSDQFSYCVAFYEALFDVRPFAGRTSAELSAAVCDGALRAPAAGRIPRGVVRAVLRGLSRDPADRFPDMHALLAALVAAPRRRRRRRIATLVGIGFVAVGVGAFALARRAPAGCTEPERLAGLWTDDARDEARAVLGAEYEPTAGHVDAWIGQWRAAQSEVCAALDDPSRQVHVQASLECLDRRLSSMHAAIDVLRSSGPDGAALATMIDTMPSPAECVDASQWLTIQPDHHTPMGRVLAATLGEDIDRIEALRYAGRHDEAVAIAIAVLAQAEIDGDHAVRAMALLTLGQLYSAHKDAELAVRCLRAATWAAEASGHVVVAVDAWTELTAVLGGQLEQYDDALAAAERAEAALFRVRDPSRAFTLAGDTAMVHSLAGKYDLALATQLEVLARGIEVYGPRHRQVSRVHLNIAAVLSHLGRLDEAVEHAEAGLSIQRELHPGPHPVTADMLSNLAAMQIQRGQTDQARAIIDEALGMLDDTSDASKTSRANALANRAGLDQSVGATAAAVEGYTEVLAIYRSMRDPDHPDVAGALHNLAGAHDKHGDAARAIALYREALVARVAGVGPEHPSTANTMHNLGSLLVRHGDLDEAVDKLERALEIRERTNVDPWRRASSNFALAKAYDKRGVRTRAIEHADRARALLGTGSPRDAEMLAALDRWQAALPPAP